MGARVRLRLYSSVGYTGVHWPRIEASVDDDEYGLLVMKYGLLASFRRVQYPRKIK